MLGAAGSDSAHATETDPLDVSKSRRFPGVTPIACATGGSIDKPVGLVHFAACGPQGVVHRVERFGDLGRDDIRQASVRVALELLADRLA